MPRRTTTRRITLTAAFLGLAAGGAAACDSDNDRDRPRDRQEDRSYYCTDDSGTVVDEDRCDDDSSRGGGFFLWSGVGARGLKVGQKVPAGGNRFPATDRAARSAAGLPETGVVPNGTVKTGVVGKGGAPAGSGGG